MILTLPDIGTSPACGPRPPNPLSNRAEPITLADLVAIIDRDSYRHAAMLRTTASKFASFARKEPEDIGIAEMDRMRRDFATSLREGKCKPASVKSYRNYVNVLLRIARQAGWASREDMLPPAWIAVGKQLKKAGARALVFYPGLVITQAQTDTWLLADVMHAANMVNRIVTLPGLTKDEFPTALEDFAFNCSCRAFAGSMLKDLNVHKLAEAAAQFEAWDRPWDKA